MGNWKLTLLAVGAILLGMGNGVWGQCIHLKDKAVVDGNSVCVGDIATIGDADNRTADQLAGVVVAEQVHGTRTIKSEQVLFAILTQSATQAGLAGRLQICGAASCEVTAGAGVAGNGGIAVPNRAAQVEQAPVMAANVHDSPAALGVDAAAAETKAGTDGNLGGGAGKIAANTGTLSEQITVDVVKELGRLPEDVQVKFDTINGALDRPAAAGQEWRLRPLTRTFLGLVQFEAQLTEGGKVLERATVEARVLVKFNALVSTQMINKGDVMTEKNFAAETRWVDRSMPTLFTQAADLIGQEAQRPIAEESMLDQRDFKPLELAVRGDAVTVYFVSGALRIKSTARAMDDGRLHQLIALRNEQTGEQFQGTLIGKDLATVGNPLDAAAEAQLREQR